MSNFQTDGMTAEKWRKERMYGARDTVLWAIVRGKITNPQYVVGSALLESDADRIIADHDLAAQLTAERERADRAEADLKQCRTDFENRLKGANEMVEDMANAVESEERNASYHLGRWQKAMAERDAALAQVAALRAAAQRQCPGCRDGEPLLNNFASGGRDVHHGGWVCPYTPTERALLADTAPQP